MSAQSGTRPLVEGVWKGGVNSIIICQTCLTITFHKALYLQGLTQADTRLQKCCIKTGLNSSRLSIPDLLITNRDLVTQSPINTNTFKQIIKMYIYYYKLIFMHFTWFNFVHFSQLPDKTHLSANFPLFFPKFYFNLK